MKKIFLLSLLMLVAVMVNAIIIGGARNSPPKKLNRIIHPVETPPPSGSGDVYWVAPDGQVGATGSISDPWSFGYAETQTVARALDYIVFRSGSYSNGSTNFIVVNPVDPPLEIGGIPSDCFKFQIR